MVRLDLHQDPVLLQVEATDTQHTHLRAQCRNTFTPTSHHTHLARPMYLRLPLGRPIHIHSNTCINRRREVILLCVIGILMMVRLPRMHIQDQEGPARAMPITQLHSLKL